MYDSTFFDAWYDCVLEQDLFSKAGIAINNGFSRYECVERGKVKCLRGLKCKHS